MKTYYLYKYRKNRRKYLDTIEAENDKDAAAQVAKQYPELKNWDLLRKKYVANKQTGELRLKE